MAKIAISIKINLNAIDNAKVFNGQKGSYLDATAFIDLDELNQFGHSGMITQSVTREEKAQGIKGNILGNTKVFWKDSGQAPQQGQQQGYQQQGYQQQQGQQQQYQQQQGGQQWQQQNQQQGQYSGQQGNHGAQQQNWQQPQNQYPQQGQPQYNNPPADYDDQIPFMPVGLQYGTKFLHCC